MLGDPSTLTRPPSWGGGPTLSDPTDQAQPLTVRRPDHQQQVNPGEFGEGLALTCQRRNLSRPQECSRALLTNTETRTHLYRHEKSPLIVRKEINLQTGNSHVVLNHHPTCGTKAFARQLFRPPPPPLLRRLHDYSIHVRA